MKKTLLLLFMGLLSSRMFAQSLAADQYNSTIARNWFNLELYLIKSGTGFTPPVAARAIGYTGLTLYQSVVGGIPDYSSLESKLPGSPVFTNPSSGTVYHWPTVANNALADIIDSLFGNASLIQKDTIHLTKVLHNAEYYPLIPLQVFNDSRALGEQIARDVFDYSRNDGGHQSYKTNTDSAFIPQVCPACWVPTFPAYGLTVQPHWGDVRCFVPENALAPCIPVAPPVFSSDTSSAFYAYAYQVYATKNNLSAGQKNIARYWADGGGSVTPPGHSLAILTQIMERENSNLAFAAIAYGKLGLSQADAFVSCWKTKYMYSLMRPITYIRQFIDTGWTSLIPTPPFPEYTSGHSTQSGAMTAVMNETFGSDYAFIDNTHGTNFGGPRSFGCFDEAAYEAATSRLYAGIHYEFSDVLGLSLGRMIGEMVHELFESTRSVTGIAHNEEVKFSLYPNPTTNYILLNSSNRLKQISVYNVEGRKVMASVNPYVLDMSSLPAGPYFIKVYDEREKLIADRQVTKQ